MNDVTRREFIQRGFASFAALLLSGVRIPPSLVDEQVIELVDFEIDDLDFACCVKVNHSKPILDELGRWCAEVTFDFPQALSCVYFIDTNGNRYPYREIEQIVEAQGEHWHTNGDATWSEVALDGYIYPSVEPGVKWTEQGVDQIDMEQKVFKLWKEASDNTA